MKAARKPRARAVQKSTPAPDAALAVEPEPGLAGHHHAPDWHHQMVEEAAYFIAQRRGFEGGDPVADWLAAEAQIDAQMTEAC